MMPYSVPLVVLFCKISNNAVANSLVKNSGLVQTETISGRGHLAGIVGPCENLRRMDFQVAEVNHMAGESIGY